MLRKCVCVCVAVVAAVVTAGCSHGGHGSGSAKASPTRPSSSAAPLLETGRSMLVRTGGNTTRRNVYRVTLVGIKAASKVTEKPSGYTFRPNKGNVLVCAELKVQLVEGKPDASAFIFPSFLGSDGRTADAQLATSMRCDAMGLAEEDLSADSNWKVGSSLDGSEPLEVPDRAGFLVYGDQSDGPLFRVKVPAA